jgi:hypothetical protein
MRYVSHGSWIRTTVKIPMGRITYGEELRGWHIAVDRWFTHIGSCVWHRTGLFAVGCSVSFGTTMSGGFWWR